MPGWVQSLLKLGATAAIAFYLVFSNQRMFETTLMKMSEKLTEHEYSTVQAAKILENYAAGADRVSDAQLRLLRVICYNTATDVLQRSRCDNN